MKKVKCQRKNFYKGQKEKILQKKSGKYFSCKKFVRVVRCAQETIKVDDVFTEIKIPESMLQARVFVFLNLNQFKKKILRQMRRLTMPETTPTANPIKIFRLQNKNPDRSRDYAF